MNFMGCAYPLFFDFLKFSFIFLLSFFLLTGIYAFIKNYMGENCQNMLFLPEDFCEKNEITIYSYYNNSFGDIDNAFTSLNLAATVILVILITKFRDFHEKTENELDRSLLSASDFTFMVEKIPLFEKEEDIKSFFEGYSKAYKINIKKINKAYHIGDYVFFKRKKEEFLKQQERLMENEEKNAKKLEVAKVQTKNMQEKIDSLEKDFENMESKFTGVAFITVDTEQG